MEVWKMAFSTMGKWIKNDVRLLPISINISRIILARLIWQIYMEKGKGIWVLEHVNKNKKTINIEYEYH